MRTIILVGLGGGIGSIFRYLTSVFVSRYFQSVFPLATFAANMLGCVLIGLSLGLFEKHPVASSDLRYLFVTGFCGGYTTFSAFASENINLLQSGHTFTAFLYMASSILISLLSGWLGLALSQCLLKI